MSQTKNQAIENQKLKLENEQLKTLVNCLQSQVYDLVIDANETKDDLSFKEILDSITPESINEPKQTQANTQKLEIGDTVVYCVEPNSLNVGTISDINDANQVFFEDAMYLQFKGQLRLTVQGKDCCIGDAVKINITKMQYPKSKKIKIQKNKK